uniref:Maturase K n=1 Tax=Wiesnerella denudata TaxID=179049 RepID=A0A7G5XUY6_9MARC|nr:maturase K [Wiesnerella denudata]QNA49820.1 maturase K [Wiesnerella denudata]
MVKVLSTIEKKKSCPTKQFIYIFFFQENLYGIAYNQFITKTNYKNFFVGLKINFNFLKIKRLIQKLRQFDLLFIFSKKNNVANIKEVIVIIFDFLFLLQSKKALKKKMNTYQSIHSIFSFMEHRIDNSTNFLDITIPYFFHPEILIRIFRRHIKDIPFLHFLRILLHKNQFFNILNIETFFHLKKNHFFSFLWNFFIYEFEYLLNNIWEKFYKFESVVFFHFIDETNSIKKINHILKTAKKSIENNIVKVKKISSIHYIRYQNNFIITLNDKNILILENWKDFFLLFWQKYFNIWFKPSRIFITNLSKNSFFFLGYRFRLRNQVFIIQIQIRNYFTNINLIKLEFCNIIPIIPLIRFLTKEKFCDVLGHPLCKLSWTTLPDNEIFERFDQIIKNIFSYYSGCFNKKGLYQLQYIFRFSCAKTLACKHKSTIRTVWKKYGSNFLRSSIFFKKTKLISLNFWQINPYKKNFWYFNIIQVNYLAHLLQKLKLSKE